MEEGRNRAQHVLDDLEREVLRASQLIEDLRRENIALRHQIESLGRGPASRRVLAPENWEEEGRRWAGERQAIADRLRAILGKFQWLEGEPTSVES
jgi:FtsZ-binding cell division protein ZapB